MFRCGIILLLVATCNIEVSAAKEIVRDKRIVGGMNYRQNDYPFHVSLWYIAANSPYYTANSNQANSCSGTLVGKRWVLTSAHCFMNETFSGLAILGRWRVYLGMFEQQKATQEAQLRTIVAVFKHPSYNHTTKYGDIALLKLNMDADVTTSRVSVAYLNKDTSCPTVGATAKVIGWGSNKNGDLNTNFPKVATLVVNSTTYCKRVYNQYFFGGVQNMFVDNTMFCAGDPTGMESSCKGDSGSPLMANCEGHAKAVVGIVTTGYPLQCYHKDYPPIFTTVSTYNTWITNTIANNT